MANITVYGTAWLMFHLQASAHIGPMQDASDQLGVQDVPVFRVSWGRSGDGGKAAPGQIGQPPRS